MAAEFAEIESYWAAIVRPPEVTLAVLAQGVQPEALSLVVVDPAAYRLLHS